MNGNIGITPSHLISWGGCYKCRNCGALVPVGDVHWCSASEDMQVLKDKLNVAIETFEKIVPMIENDADGLYTWTILDIINKALIIIKSRNA
jgi:hypothetical protein